MTIAYWRIVNANHPTATAATSSPVAAGRRRRAITASSSATDENANAGTSVMKLTVSGPQSGPAATAPVTRTTPSQETPRVRAVAASAPSPTTPSSAVVTWSAPTSRVDTSATGAATSSWPTRLIETQWLKDR